MFNGTANAQPAPANNDSFKDPTTARVFELVLPSEPLFGNWGGPRSKPRRIRHYTETDPRQRPREKPQRQLFSAEIDLSESQVRHLLAVIDLYRALGGGWSDDEIGKLMARPATAQQ